MKIVFDKAAAEKIRQNMANYAVKFSTALVAAANMAASMIQTAAIDAIRGAGLGTLTGGFHVDVEGSLNNMRLSMASDDERLALFQTGGVISGHPFLWIPISGTDAVGVQARDFGGLYSANPPGHRPLLFSVQDRKPKYFGIASVTVRPRIDLNAVQEGVMTNFRQFFGEALR